MMIMTNKLLHFVFVLMAFQMNIQVQAQEIKRDSLFDANWKFFRGKAEGAEKLGFDDKVWRMIDLPHDWSIEDLPNQGTSKLPNGKTHIISGPFDSESVTAYNTGYTVGGTGWYRKHFKLSENLADKVISVNFDGVYMNADVWINGHHLGNHPYGYTAFGFDLSKYLNFGESENILAVEVKNEGINSRWYSGSGIYRHVYLDITDKLHIARWGTFITTIQADSSHAIINIKATVNNQTLRDSDIVINYTILDENIKKVATKKLSTRISKSVSSTLNVSFEIMNPEVWSPETPKLYKAICKISANNKIIDSTETCFGIRTIRFDAQNGFILNGKKYRIKGGAMHSNNGPLGAIANNRAEERRVELMKNAGFNAIRCGHNPPSTAFLDACDKIGMLVMDEAFDVWVKGERKDDYHVYFKDWWKSDMTSMIMRDRNHPSIFTWSICNQVAENADSIGIALGYEVGGYVRALDPTRPVSANVAQFRGAWRNCTPEDWRKCDPFFATLDICGYSYQSSQYENDHKRLPDRIMFSSEIDPRHSFDNWMKVEDLNYVLGNFEWTAMDYMGEAGYGWNGFKQDPSTLYSWTLTYSGDIDICGYKRPRSYYREVLFKTGTKLSAFVFSPIPSFKGNFESPWGWDDVKPSWTWPGYEGKSLAVVAYSACDSVSLFLNNKLIETKTTSRQTEFKATWQVPYESGILKAIGYINGMKSAEWELVTAGKPAKISLTADRKTIAADGQDLSYVTVEVLDKNGVLNPQFNDLIHFSIEGEGTIAAVGNSNPKSVESFQQPYRKAYEGKCLVIIRSKSHAGQIILHANSKGLASEKIVIKTK
jgi:beta-galactosidase